MDYEDTDTHIHSEDEDVRCPTANMSDSEMDCSVKAAVVTYERDEDTGDNDNSTDMLIHRTDSTESGHATMRLRHDSGKDIELASRNIGHQTGQTRPLPPGVISHGLTCVHPTSQATVARRTDDAHLVGVDRPRGDGGHWGQSSVDGDYGSQVRDSRSSQSHRPARHTAKCFTVLADETTDSGRKEQLAVCVRYVQYM